MEWWCGGPCAIPEYLLDLAIHPPWCGLPRQGQSSLTFPPKTYINIHNRSIRDSVHSLMVCDAGTVLALSCSPTR